MIDRLRSLAERRVDFAFETTLASRSFASWLGSLTQTGYSFHLVFLWPPSAEAALARVAARVSLGRHDVPEDIVRRRYNRGLINYFDHYQPIATTWRMYDNSTPSPRLIARGRGNRTTHVADPATWKVIRHAQASEE